MRPGNPSSRALNEDELLFLWKGLVEEGRLSVPKLQQFMEIVAGVRMTVVQAKDLLDYMDANGDGRVGMEDFKSFLSVGHLADTDVKSFMWEPKKKFQEEHAAQDSPDAYHVQHPHSRESSIGQYHDDHARRTSSQGHPDRMASNAGDDRHGRKMSYDLEGDHLDRSVTVHVVAMPPEAKKRPHPVLRARTMTSRLSRQDEEIQAEETPRAGFQQRKTVTGADLTKKMFKRPPAITPETEQKIEQALLKYEEKSWEKFLGEEKTFKRQLFEQFSGLGNDDLSPAEYHKMLMKWVPLASWCAPSGLRPADSLAALEYVQRRDYEDRGVIPHKIPPEPSRPHDSDAPSGTQALPPQQVDAARLTATALCLTPLKEEPMLPTEASMSFKLWLDVIDGKHRPEEHITELRKSSKPHPLDTQVYS